MSFEQNFKYTGFRELAAEIESKTTLRQPWFTDIMAGKETPRGDYGEAIQTNIEVNGRPCDIYFSKPGSRVYIHYKD